MIRWKKVVAVGMSVALTVGSIGMGESAWAAGLPTTEGHDKYVNKNVFSVIGSDTFGTKDLESPLFDKTKGSQDITNLQVPVLAYDDTSIGLVWEKPEKYDNVADYNVYINGVKKGTARENFKVNAEWTSVYMQAFYDYYDGTGETAGVSDVDMVNVDIHSYRATGLTPNTEYKFEVVAVDANGKELGTKQSVTQKTTKTPETVNIVDFGAKTSDGYTTYNDEINKFIEANTKAIQAAIDACPVGGKVVVPEGIYVTGALWLKSDMTLEVNGTLWASPNSDHFEIGFLMYPFYTDTRGWGLINAQSSDENNPIKNVRVTGSGQLYGNGWKYGSGDKMYGDGYTSNAGINKQAGDPADTAKYGLPRFMGGSNTKVYYYGIQAADSAKKYLLNVTNEDGTKKYSEELVNKLADVIKADLEDNGKIDKNGKDSFYDTVNGKKLEIAKTDITNAYATRSSLLIMRNCENVYVGDITIANPANHSVNILDSRNIATNNVKVFSFDGNNADGLGYGCSQNVICWNNFTDTGDDNLGFGASVGEAARDCDIQTNSELWMFNNFLREGHGGLAAGSHTGNGIQDVLFEDTVMNHIDMAFRFKSALTNGGFAANITMRDCAVADTNQGWVLTTSYSDPNSASSTEAAEIGEFYNFAAYNVSMYSIVQNTICVYADVNPESNPNKPWHTHHNLYFQDITFGDVGRNGKYKYYSGWDTLTGCENSVFYNVKTVSYNSKAVKSKTDKAWSNIKYCKNVRFQGTTMDSLNAVKSNMENIMSAPVVAAASTVDVVSADDGQSVDLTWTQATDNSNSVRYTVETYVGDTMVDMKAGIVDKNKYTVTGLSSGVEYNFKVYVCDATGNKTLLGAKKVTTSGTKDETAITAPADVTVTTSNSIYTHTQAAWANAKLADARVRGYKVYANGEYKKTIYNYEIPNVATAETVSKQIGRLATGTDNKIEIVAFTDAGVELKYTQVTAKTLKNYDYKCPVFADDAKLTATVNGSDVVLSWNVAKDDTKVGGYRVYVDGKPVLGADGKAFNPVNGAKTTTENTYTVKGVDTTVAHTFRVEAGDSWWKAETTMGTYDKMAGFNWTNGGLETTLKGTPVFSDKVTDIKDESGNVIEIEADADKGVVEQGTRLVVTDRIDNNMFEAVKKLFNNDKILPLDIKLVDDSDAEVQPNGIIKISIKLPAGFRAETTKVYHIDASGNKTDMNASISDGIVSFETNHFSTYVLVDATEIKDTPPADTDADTDAVGDGSSASSGDTTNILLYAAIGFIALIAGGFAIFCGKKRRS